MPIYWKLNDELDEVWHSSFGLIFLLWQPKNGIFMAKKGFQFLSKIRDSGFCQKFDIFFRFFHRSSAKSRRTAKRPTVLSSLLNMLTILIIFRKIYFLSNFRICYITFFAKNGKNQNFLGLNSNLLEIKRRARRGMTFLIRTYIFVMAAKKRNFYYEKRV